MLISGQDCETLLKKYEEAYYEIIDGMKENNTTPWTCSASYIFGISNKFKDRLDKVGLTEITFY